MDQVGQYFTCTFSYLVGFFIPGRRFSDPNIECPHRPYVQTNDGLQAAAWNLPFFSRLI